MNLSEILQKQGQIAFSDICRVMIEGDLTVRSMLLDFVRNNSQRIHPAPGDEWLRDEWFRYYVDCIAATDGDIRHAASTAYLSRFEAAGSLVNLFEWLLQGNAGGSPAAETMANAITDLFRRSDIDLRNCIETGFLEHVLEISESRSFFNYWSRDLDLADSYKAALTWGKAHERVNASAKRR